MSTAKPSGLRAVLDTNVYFSAFSHRQGVPFRIWQKAIAQYTLLVSPAIEQTKSSAQLPRAALENLVEEATVDCYNETEQATGLCTMIEDNLALPFKTLVLGVPVEVIKVDIAQDDSIVAICVRGRQRQAIPLLDLPLPSPRPRGAQWIEAYRHWARGG